MRKRSKAAWVALLWALPAVAAAEVNAADTTWIMTATALVLFMTLPGLGLFYAGLVGQRNVIATLLQCFAIACLATVLWVIYGYSLAFSDGGAWNAWLGGLSNMFLAESGREVVNGTIPESVFLMFQLTFAIITPVLIIGGFAERIRFAAVLLFSALWLTVVYFPVTHWVWGGGWLADMGVMDFAGGLVVHLTAGISALVAALAIGARDGFPSGHAPHNLTMSFIGAGMLWVGWFGFNGGSALAAGSDAGMAILVTHISAAVGALTWMTIEWLRYGKPTMLGIITGMVAGLGSITPASGFVGPMGAIAIGLTAGTVCLLITNYMKQALKIDDSLDVFAVHGVGGVIGTLLCGVFVASQFGGVGLAAGVTIGEQVLIQATGVLAVGVWSALATFVILKVVNVITMVRATPDEELVGLDRTQHSESGYRIH